MATLTKEQFQQRIQAIGTCTDDAERRTLLADLITDGEETFDGFATIQSERDTARSDNEKLREANMKLFLKVGDHKNPDDGNGGKPAEKKSFDDLFDEKGGIK